VLGDIRTFDTASIKAAIEALGEEIGWKLKPLTLVIRGAVTGRRVGPPLYESLELLGREKSLARLARAQDVLGEGPRDA
jgi:glutamyl-tRNA synthetase